MPRILFATSVFLLLMVVGGGCGNTSSSPGASKSPARPRPSYDSQHPAFLRSISALAQKDGCSVTVEKNGGAQHIGEGDHLGITHDPYPSDPPTSGPHFGIVTAWGFYTSPVQDEYIVHNLEHGGIAVWYTGSPTTWRKTLDPLLTKGTKIVVTPRPKLAEGAFAVGAWRVLLQCAPPAGANLSPADQLHLIKAFLHNVGSTGSPAEAKIPAYVTGTRTSFAASNDPSSPKVALPRPPKPTVDTSVH